MTTETDMAQALRKWVEKKWRIVPDKSAYKIGQVDCATEVMQILRAHESRAQPASVTDGMQTVYVVQHAEWSNKYGRYVYPAFADLDTHDDLAAGISNRWHAVKYTRAPQPPAKEGE